MVSINKYIILVIILLSIVFQSYAQIKTDNLLNELRFALKLDCTGIVEVQLIDSDCICKVDGKIVSIEVKECQPEYEEVELIVNDIMALKDTSLIPAIKSIENEYVGQFSEAWIFFEKNHRNCTFLREQYDIAILLEMCIKALQLSNIENNEIIFEIFDEYRNYWLSLLISEAKGLRSDITFSNKFLDNRKYKFNGCRTSLIFVIPYLTNLESYFVKDLETILIQYDQANYIVQQKFVRTKLFYTQIDNIQIDSLIVKYKENLYQTLSTLLPMFELLPSRKNPHIEYLIELLYSDSIFLTNNGFQTISSFPLIYTNPWGGIYPDRSKNKEKARNILEQKILEKAKETTMFHRTSNILADTYRDERMAKLLIDIYPVLKNKEEKSKIVRLLTMHSPTLNNYSNTTIESINTIMSKN